MIMEELFKPYNRYHNGMDDTLYYHVIDKNTGTEAYVFSEYNSVFINQQRTVTGKCYYIHTSNLEEKYHDSFKIKRINGKSFINMGYRKMANDFVVNPDISIKNFVEQNKLFSSGSFNNIFSYNYTAFDEACVIGVSEPRRALKALYYNNITLKTVVDEIIKEFNIDIDNLGITGSLALGSDNVSDYDIVFYADINKLNQIKRKIDSYRIKNGNVNEYGFKWPCRYYDNKGNLICCFFNCLDYNYQSLHKAEVVDCKYKFSVMVKEDIFSILKAPVLETDDEVGSIILFNSGFKGVFKKGDKISGCGKIIRYFDGGKEKHSILCLSPYDEIYNDKSFFRGMK